MSPPYTLFPTVQTDNSRLATCRRGLFRVSNVIAMLLFAASAAVQYNDDDGVLWAAIYATGTVIVIVYSRVL